MTEKAILITGASGEIGNALIEYLSVNDPRTIVALDLREVEAPTEKVIPIQGNICDFEALKGLFSRYDFEMIFHLAAILSTGGERDPFLTHSVNVEGSVNLLKLAEEQSRARGASTTFLFPSTIAAYGIPSLKKKQKYSSITEDQFLEPITIYGVNKLYVENIGRYISDHFQALSEDSDSTNIDFRAVRFPGILSAHSVPSGGTSDYGPEMLHAAAKGEAYKCFVNPESTIPFMVMPDAVKALIDLAKAPASKLTHRVYNVTSFSVSAKDIQTEVTKYFPGADISYEIHPQRLAIVESWPMDVNDTAARQDWDWKPDFNFSEAFEKYLVPGIMERYHGTGTQTAAGW